MVARRVRGGAFWTLNAFRQPVQTWARFVEVPSWIRILCRFGFQRRRVARKEWLRALPKLGCFPQE